MRPDESGCGGFSQALAGVSSVAIVVIIIVAQVPPVVPDVTKLRIERPLIARQIAGIFGGGPTAAAADVFVQAYTVACDVVAHAIHSRIVMAQIAPVVVDVPVKILGHRKSCKQS